MKCVWFWLTLMQLREVPSRCLLKSFLLKRESHCSSDPQRQTKRHPHTKGFRDGFGTLQNSHQSHKFHSQQLIVGMNGPWGRCPFVIDIWEMYWLCALHGSGEVTTTWGCWVTQDRGWFWLEKEHVTGWCGMWLAIVPPMLFPKLSLKSP